MTAQHSQSTNFDQQELNKFQKIASEWWNPTGSFKPLHDINPLRLKWIAGQIPLAGKTVLDVGCGGGILAESIAQKGANVLGIDLVQDSIDAAKAHALQNEVAIQYECISVEDLCNRHSNHFDIVTCMEMLEHVPEPALIIDAIAHILKPGGLAFFSTFNRNLIAYAHAILGAEYILGLLPKGTHDYQKFIQPSELAAMCRQVRLFPEKIEGMRLNLITRQYETTTNTSVNYLLSCRKLI